MLVVLESEQTYRQAMIGAAATCAIWSGASRSIAEAVPFFAHLSSRAKV